jgi:hypothetical protein
MKLLDKMTGAYMHPDRQESTVRLYVDQDAVIYETMKSGHIGGVINVGTKFAHADRIDVEICLYLPDPDNTHEGEDGLSPVRADYRSLVVQHNNEEEYKTVSAAWFIDEFYAPYGGFVRVINKGSFERKLYYYIYRRD